MKRHYGIRCHIAAFLGMLSVLSADAVYRETFEGEQTMPFEGFARKTEEAGEGRALPC